MSFSHKPFHDMIPAFLSACVLHVVLFMLATPSNLYCVTRTRLHQDPCSAYSFYPKCSPLPLSNTSSSSKTQLNFPLFQEAFPHLPRWTNPSFFGALCVPHSNLYYSLFMLCNDCLWVYFSPLYPSFPYPSPTYQLGACLEHSNRQLTCIEHWGSE